MSSKNKQPLRTYGDWSEFMSSGGKIYFYNSKTEKAQWEKPEEWDWLISQEEKISKNYYPSSSSSSSSNKDYSRNEYNSGRHRSNKFENDTYDSSYQKRPPSYGNISDYGYEHKSYSKDYSNDYKHSHSRFNNESSQHHHSQSYIQSQNSQSNLPSSSCPASHENLDHESNNEFNFSGYRGPASGFDRPNKDHNEKSWASNSGYNSNQNYRGPKSGSYSSSLGNQKSYRDDDGHNSKVSPRYHHHYPNSEDLGYTRSYSSGQVQQPSKPHVSRYESYTETSMNNEKGESSHHSSSRTYKKESRTYSRNSSRSSSENNRSPSYKRSKKHGSEQQISPSSRVNNDDSMATGSSSRNSKSPNSSKAEPQSGTSIITQAQQVIKEEKEENESSENQTKQEPGEKTACPEPVSKLEDPRLSNLHKEKPNSDNPLKTEDSQRENSKGIAANQQTSAPNQRESLISPEDINKYYRPELVQRLAASLGVVENLSIINQPYMKQFAFTNIGVELKNHRSTVRIKEIKKTLLEQRLFFLENHLKQIEEILN